MFNIFGKKNNAGAPNAKLSKVDSMQKAEDGFMRGDLEKMYMVPLEFGGHDFPTNMLYVPAGTVSIKAGIDQNVIMPLIENGTVTQYKAIPEYQGTSLVPTRVKIVAKNPGNFVTTIDIWGDALEGG